MSDEQRGDARCEEESSVEGSPIESKDGTEIPSTR